MSDMDDLLRRSMSAPVPRLSADFGERLSAEICRRSEPRKRFSRILLAGYGAVSALASVVVMRGQGLGWGAIAVMTIGPLGVIEVVRRARGYRRYPAG